MRDRLIRLVGHGQLSVTTQVFEEAADRVSRYLRVQLIVNVSYGVPVGVALYAIGIPNAALWGLLAIALRFIPYIGAWIAAAMPIALAFAISDGWSLVIWTVAVFVVLELISNNVVEPWVVWVEHRHVGNCGHRGCDLLDLAMGRSRPACWRCR